MRKTYRKILTPLLCTIYAAAFAQTSKDSIKYSFQKRESISLETFYANHGTGDLSGLMIAIGYKHQFRSRLSFYTNLAFTVNSADDFSYRSISQPPNTIDKTVALHFVTAGLQTSPTLFYTLLKSKKQQLNIGAGTIIRFQNTSLPEKYGYGYDNSQDRQPSYKIYKTHPTTLSIGYQFALDYKYLITNKMEYGLKGFYQNDTNSDLIVGVGLTFARKFSFAK
ncbi:hypothetical protein I5M32_03040 [Pedobacter sp. SD-b]|uniref:Outer membrane protein beta-barrel domain-containing protein n=1 Tax=Pedobacter segetis TaxID=2793069 RepID=A0ABS1BGC5_9SPHI|nr:hypothetical protein [Pedobacter segetis]MBK0381923.1 hypothetical protein [Pedobacter segetis]